MPEGEGKEVRLLRGSACGATAPVATPFELFCLDTRLQPGATLPLPDTYGDCGVGAMQGAVTVAGQDFTAGRMMVLRPGDDIGLKAGLQGARPMLPGGSTMDRPRQIWWNFVASSPARIDAANAAWRAGDGQHGRFQLSPGDAAEHRPLPENGSKAAGPSGLSD